MVSDEEGEKDAKRQRSEPTTPVSTSDEVMGITQVEPREAERFEEGIDRNSKMLRKRRTGRRIRDKRSCVCGAFHGGFGDATLQECLDRINQSRTDALATCHSGVMVEDSPKPPQVMSPNVEEEHIHEKPQSPDDESQPRIKEERKEEGDPKVRGRDSRN